MKKAKAKIAITRRDVKRAVWRAFDGHEDKAEVQEFIADFDRRADELWRWLQSGEWERRLRYRQLEKTNKNGKRRKIDSPDLTTRIYQHLFIYKVLPLYVPKDNRQRKNCKKGFGITAKKKSHSVLSRVKHMVYDRRDINFLVKIDQRKCYEHIRPQTFRKELRLLITDEWFLDFAVKICFVRDDGGMERRRTGGCPAKQSPGTGRWRLPIGTPSSPVAHHIVMLRFDKFKERICEYSVGYADDDIMGTRTLEEAHRAAWRAKWFMWYEYGIRLKGAIIIHPAWKPIDFCGYITNRNENKSVCDHDKGHCKVRKSTLDSARKATKKNWPSYYGLMKPADTWTEMRRIEKDMKLQQLTEKIRIDRRLDARNIDMKEIAGRPVTIVDYEIKTDAKGNPNWIKCLIGVPEVNGDGETTGKVLAREFHGNYAGLYTYLKEVEKVVPKREILPIEDAVIVNQCGYIFEGSTNQIEYIS